MHNITTLKCIRTKTPLTYVLTSGKLSANGQRWVNELAEFSFSIHVDNKVADFLSRNPKKPPIQITVTDVHAMLDGNSHVDNADEKWTPMINVMKSDLNNLKKELIYTIYTIMHFQNQDNYLKVIMDWKKKDIKIVIPDMRKQMLTTKGKSWLRKISKIVINQDDLLFEKLGSKHSCCYLMHCKR